MKCDLGRRRAHHIRELIPHDLHDSLRRREAVHNLFTDSLFLYFCYEILDKLEIDIRFKESHPDFTKCLVDIVFRQLPFTGKV